MYVDVRRCTLCLCLVAVKHPCVDVKRFIWPTEAHTHWLHLFLIGIFPNSVELIVYSYQPIGIEIKTLGLWIAISPDSFRQGIHIALSPTY